MIHSRNGVRIVRQTIIPISLVAQAFKQHGIDSAVSAAFVLRSKLGMARGFDCYDDEFEPGSFVAAILARGTASGRGASIERSAW